MKLYAIAVRNQETGRLTIYADDPTGIRLFESPSEAASRVRELFGAPQPQPSMKFHVVEVGNLLPEIAD